MGITEGTGCVVLARISVWVWSYCHCADKVVRDNLASFGWDRAARSIENSLHIWGRVSIAAAAPAGAIRASTHRKWYGSLGYLLWVLTSKTAEAATRQHHARTALGGTTKAVHFELLQMGHITIVQGLKRTNNHNWHKHNEKVHLQLPLVAAF